HGDAIPIKESSSGFAGVLRERETPSAVRAVGRAFLCRGFDLGSCVRLRGRGTGGPGVLSRPASDLSDRRTGTLWAALPTRKPLVRRHLRRDRRARVRGFYGQVVVRLAGERNLRAS
ncbi:Hypothetical predicted protein, partial [Podarcis lilfordi]